MIRFRCDGCGKQLKVADSLAGKRGKCPRCGAVVNVPKPVAERFGPVTSPSHASSFASLLPAVRKADHEEWIDMTAMVDVVFFLLIFFMVTSLNSQQASIEMPVPEAEQSAAASTAKRRSIADFEADEDYLIVRIEADDTVWIEDVEAPTRTDVVQKIRQGIRGDDAGLPGPNRLLVVASGDAHHGAAVMVMDAGREAGIEDIRLAVEEES
jgi:biopolymer transport protein ExbD